MESLTNKIMHSHFSWFDKELIVNKGKNECTEGQTEVLSESLEQKEVFKYWITQLLQSKRKLDTVSYDEVMYERGIISWREYEKRIKDDTLVYPFKKEA